MKMSPNHLLTAIDDRDLGEARLDNRLCLEPGLLIEVFRLRYFAYAEKEYIAPNSQAMFLDHFDALPNCISFGVFLGDQIAGTLRACIYDRSRKWTEIPSKDKYPEAFSSVAEASQIIVEWGRLAILPRFRRRGLAIELALLGSVPFLASFLPSPDFVCAVREEHIRFYSHFGYKQITPFVQDKHLNYASTLMHMHWRDHAERIKSHRMFSRAYRYMPQLQDLDSHARNQFLAKLSPEEVAGNS